MDKTKELIKLTKQAVKLVEQHSDVEVIPLEATSIASIAVIHNYDADAFGKAVLEKVREMERQGAVNVEIQFSTSYYSNPAGFVLMNSALLIGRKYANSKTQQTQNT